MKKVLIDLTQLPLQRTGVGIYALNYIRCLQAGASGRQLHFLVLDDDAELLRETRAVPSAVVKPLKAALFRRFAFRVLLEQVGIPGYALAAGIDAVHSLHYSFPLASFGRFKRIVTVCDMSFFLFPELHVPVKRLFFQYFIRKLPKTEGLLFISESTLRDFRRYFPGSQAPEQVIPLGADLARLDSAPDAALVESLRGRFGIDRYVLYVGTIEPRKNILGLVKAFEAVAGAHPDIKLVIAGKLGWDYQDLLDYIDASPLRERIVLTGYINEAEKHALLKSALLFTYVSFYEGFGLPPLEGMAAGVPTITSNISSMPEVAGQAAVQVDPGNIGQIAEAMNRLLGDPEERARLIERGLQQSRLFTWEGMTATSLAFYDAVLEPSAVTT
ncbi:glycosyltransferase family 4 protein [Noviherbaspirillum aerium]|uniref:glycosyltransferase family 4 protein n=1 Tax=Noviherbaspirillum aerium TaxID=2588497 RepID=UPI00124BCFEA|nr:glycosyltransferase family 1 protein [Noviherbaspirillum aerium]